MKAMSPPPLPTAPEEEPLAPGALEAGGGSARSVVAASASARQVYTYRGGRSARGADARRPPSTYACTVLLSRSRSKPKRERACGVQTAVLGGRCRSLSSPRSVRRMLSCASAWLGLGLGFGLGLRFGLEWG